MTHTCIRFTFDACTLNLGNCRRWWETPGCRNCLVSQRRERRWPRKSHSLQERFLGWIPCRGGRNARRRAVWKPVGKTPQRAPCSSKRGSQAGSVSLPQELLRNLQSQPCPSPANQHRHRYPIPQLTGGGAGCLPAGDFSRFSISFQEVLCGAEEKDCVLRVA